MQGISPCCSEPCFPSDLKGLHEWDYRLDLRCWVCGQAIISTHVIQKYYYHGIRCLGGTEYDGSEIMRWTKVQTVEDEAHSYLSEMDIDEEFLRLMLERRDEEDEEPTAQRERRNLRGTGTTGTYGWWVSTVLESKRRGTRDIMGSEVK